MKKPTITFVTFLIGLNENRDNIRSLDTYISLFKTLASSGIAICLYVSYKNEIIGIELENEFPNVKLMKITNLEDTETYKLISQYTPLPTIPKVTNIMKDTYNYFILMNSKCEFVYNVSLLNPFNTEHFAWIDIGICHIISNPDIVLQKLYTISHSKLINHILLFPCAWPKEKSFKLIHLVNTEISWRFCGGVFIGDKKSIKDMHFLIQEKLPIFIKKYGVIIWEVNIWAWLEYNCNWVIDEYNADHNDSILNIPLNILSDDSEFVDCERIIDLDNANDNANAIHKHIDKIVYINLEHRKDRRKEIEFELNNFNIKYKRFDAILTPEFGILGCGLSHLEVIKNAKRNKLKRILILEDDFKFIISKTEFEKQITMLFETDKFEFDVCMISYNLLNGKVCETHPYLTRVFDAQTASGYIVNESIYDKLIALYETAMPLLELTHEHWNYANDQIWKTLQVTSKWYCFTNRLGKQRASFSDNSKLFQCEYDF